MNTKNLRSDIMFSINLRTFVSIILTLAVCSLNASPVDVNQAKDLAAKFRNSGKVKRKSPKPITSDQITLSYTAQTSSGDCFYVFNTEDNGGYTIVAADDRITEILGYSDSGNFNPNNIPDNMRWWLSEYQKEIDYFLNNYERYRVIKKATPEFPSIEPKTTTKWNQNAPYNNLCPMDGSSRSVTGCVATAMAQVMKYRNWPTQPTGSHGGVTFTGTTYDWGNMLDVYEEGKYNTSQSNAVATLMRHCGASVDMNYSSSASGAYSRNVGYALYTYFGYNKDLIYNLRDYYTYDEWVKLVYDEIANNGPAYYAGQANSGGHAFVCDGYSGNGYFHFNWGWGGSQDGYFRLFSLNPKSGGIGSFDGGYNSSQSVYTNLKKASAQDGDYQTLMIANNGYLFSDGKIAFENNGLFYNPTGRQEHLLIGVTLRNLDNEKDSIVFGVFSKDLDSNYGYRTLSVSIPSNLPNGDYRMNIVYQNRDNKNDTWHDVMTLIGSRDYLLVTKRNSGAVVYNQEVYGDYKLIVNSVESMGGDFYSNTDNYFNVIVSNVGESDYRDNVKMLLYKNPTDSKPVAEYDFQVVCPRGVSVVPTVTQNMSVSPGDYYAVFKDIYENVMNDPIKVTFKSYTSPITKSSNLSATDITPGTYELGSGNLSLGVTFNNKGTSTISCTIGFELYSIDNKLIKSWNTTSAVSIKSGSANYKYSMNMGTNITPGYYYWRFKNKTTGDVISENAFMKITESSQIVNGLLILPYSTVNAEIQESKEGSYSGDVVIPEKAGAYIIDKIAGNAFTFSPNLEEITIPASISGFGNGQFYACDNLKKITLQSSSIPSVTSFTFGPDAEKNIELVVPRGMTNLYMNEPIWNKFFFPSWEIELDGVEIDGLSINPETNEIYSPYYINRDEEIEISINNSNLEWMMCEYIIGDSEPVIIPIEDKRILLPALGDKNGKVKLYYSEEAGIEKILDDGMRGDVYSIDGRLILKNAGQSDISKLPKGIYIINGKKFIIK